MKWQLNEAQDQLPALVTAAQTEGPQIILLHGEQIAIVLSSSDYEALRPAKPNMIDALLSGPAWDDEFAGAVTHRKSEPDRDALIL